MSTTLPQGPVLVMGAGCIGGWLGGRLQAAGVSVHFVGRPRMQRAMAARGLTLTDLDDSRIELPASALQLHGAVPSGLVPALVLLCVKSVSTGDAAAELGARLPPGTVVLSMQNGVGNAPVARAAAPRLTVLPGLVSFNVAETGPGHLHRGTDGQLLAQDHPLLRDWQPVFERAGLPVDLFEDLAALQWGKLLMNLNNAVNALSCLPLREQLLNRDYRCCTAALISETLSLLQRVGIQPAPMASVRPDRMPTLLRLPTPLFRLAARHMLRIDGQARSSMAEDFARGRQPEVDAIHGEVLRLATSVGALAPINARIAELVRGWPRHRHPVSGASMRRSLGV